MRALFFSLIAVGAAVGLFLVLGAPPEADDLAPGLEDDLATDTVPVGMGPRPPRRGEEGLAGTSVKAVGIAGVDPVPFSMREENIHEARLHLPSGATRLSGRQALDLLGKVAAVRFASEKDLQAFREVELASGLKDGESFALVEMLDWASQAGFEMELRRGMIRIRRHRAAE